MPIVQTKPLLRRAGESLRGVLGPRAFYVINAYAPYIGAGVRVYGVAPDVTWFDVRMHLRPWNKNYFGTHFGGSLYAMCDPFFAIILTENLGPDYVVWDKEATIRFKRPGRGVVHARFEVPRKRIDEVRSLVERRGGKAEVRFTAHVLDEHEDVIAEVEKRESVRRKR